MIEVINKMITAYQCFRIRLKISEISIRLQRMQSTISEMGYYSNRYDIAHDRLIREIDSINCEVKEISYKLKSMDGD